MCTCMHVSNVFLSLLYKLLHPYYVMLFAVKSSDALRRGAVTFVMHPV